MKTRVLVSAIYAITIFSLTLSLCSPLLAQESAQAAASAVDQSTRDEVVRFMELIQVRSRITMMLDSMRVQQKRLAEQSLKTEKPNATPQEIQRTDRVVDTALNSVLSDQTIDQMISALVPIYQRHFSKADLDGILAFYTSPVGQKLQNETPAITQESMQATTDIISKKLPEIQQALKAQMDKMAAEDKKVNSGEAKN
jgi:hypothetical protein